MATVQVDLIDGARYRERDGKLVEISRVAIISGLPVRPTDLVLNSARAFLQLNGQGPQTPHPTHTNLTLRDRVLRPLDPTIVIAELVYSLPGDQPAPPNFPIAVAGGASSAQIETMVDRDGVPITVEHPPGSGIKQGGVIHPLVAEETLRLSEVAQSSDPTLTQRVFSNTVNEGPFFFDCGAIARTWLIEEIAFELLDAESTPLPTWSFRYSLRKKPIVIAGIAGSHDPQVFFKDPETGQPPEGLTAGVGYKTIPWHFSTNFAVLFGACGF